MSVLRPWFSERVFEFSFNAEYAARNRAVSAGAPSISTRNEEKSLSYGLMFQLAKLPEEAAPALANAGKLLADYFGLSLLVEVRK